MSSIEELRKDVAELLRLVGGASRKRVVDLLTLEMRRLETEILNKEEKEKQKAELNSANQGAGDASKAAEKTNKPTTQTKIYTKHLDSYGWDQSERFMKIYVSAKGVENLPKENVQCDFDEESFKLRINELDNFNHELSIINLLHPILPSESYAKIKSGTVLLMLKKKEDGKTWGFVTQQERKVKDKPMPKPDLDPNDPNAGMMNMLQKMYDDGDDEMKRTITKAMYESRNKSGGAEMPMM